ncbi:MAG TPA: hypothetical protein VG943_18695 [Caulobacterales bacterium]|nr:hypothetical protein [Caulobacterales bacterium]
MTVVELAPVVKTVDVRRSAHDAFRIFTEEVARWWPMETHTRARSAQGQFTKSVVIEPRVGGRVYEMLQDGAELDWGRVSAYEPGALFAMQWSLGKPLENASLVSVRFEPLSDQSCRVTLTHENWERLGADAKSSRDAYANGWATVFEKCFADYAGRL